MDSIFKRENIFLSQPVPKSLYGLSRTPLVPKGAFSGRWPDTREFPLESRRDSACPFRNENVTRFHRWPGRDLFAGLFSNAIRLYKNEVQILVEMWLESDFQNVVQEV